MKKVKNNNGHTISKKRGLSDKEKEAIKKMFISCNGIIKDDMAAQMKASVGKDVSIFQVTGAIVTFHRQVAKGEIVLKDMKAYKAFMDARRAKWASYKSDRYQNYKKRLIKGKKVPAAVLKAVTNAKPVSKIPVKPKASKTVSIAKAKPTPEVSLKSKAHFKVLTPKNLKKALQTDLASKSVIQNEIDKMQIALTQFYKSASLVLNNLISASK